MAFSFQGHSESLPALLLVVALALWMGKQREVDHVRGSARRLESSGSVAVISISHSDLWPAGGIDKEARLRELRAGRRGSEGRRRSMVVPVRFCLFSLGYLWLQHGGGAGALSVRGGALGALGSMRCG